VFTKSTKEQKAQKELAHKHKAQITQTNPDVTQTHTLLFDSSATILDGSFLCVFVLFVAKKKC